MVTFRGPQCISCTRPGQGAGNRGSCSLGRGGCTGAWQLVCGSSMCLKLLMQQSLLEVTS